MKVTLEVNVVKAGGSYVAAVQLGGIVVRGRRAESPLLAVRNLFWKLGRDDGDDDAGLAIDLAIEGTTLEDQLALDAPRDGG